MSARRIGMDASAAAAVAGALSALCGRTLRETRDLEAAKVALGAMLRLLDPNAVLPLSPSSSSADAAHMMDQVHATFTAGQHTAHELSIAFLRNHYRRWAATLLADGLRNWRAALTSAQARELFDSQLLLAPPREALEALGAALHRCGGSGGSSDATSTSLEASHASVLVGLLASMLREGRVRCFWDTLAATPPPTAGRLAASEEEEDEAVCSLLVALPSRVSNALRAAPPAALAPSAFYRALVSELLAAYERRVVVSGAVVGGAVVSGAVVSGGEAAAVGLSARAVGTAGMLLGRLARLGHFGVVLEMIVDSMAANGADDAAGGGSGSSHGLACQLLAALPAFASEAALEAGVLLAARGRVSTVTLCALFTPLLRASPAARLVLRERLLLVRILPTAALPALVALLRAIPADVEIGDELKGELGGEIGGEGGVAGLGAHYGALAEATRAVAEAWSAPSHVTHAPMRQQRYLTAALVHVLEALPTSISSAITTTLLSGVQVHLGAPDEAIRRLGMRVAEVVSCVIDPDHPLRFEGAASDDDDEHEDEGAVKGTVKGAVKEHKDEGRSIARPPPPPPSAPSRPDEAHTTGGASGAGATRSTSQVGFVTPGGASSTRSTSQVGQVRRRRHGRRRSSEAPSWAADEEEDEEIDPDAPAVLPGTADEWPGSADGGGPAHPMPSHAERAGKSVPSGGERVEDDHEDPAAEEHDGAAMGTDEDEGTEGDDDDDAGSEGSYEAFDLADDRTDLRATPSPRHLRQLLAGLRAKEGEHELLDTALSAAEVLIRAAPDTPELHALCPPLARALLHLADTYRLARFGERRHGALIALAVRSPVAAAEFLTAEFYSEHVSLEMRLEVLRVVHATAEELGAPTTARVGPAAARVAPAGEAPSTAPGTTAGKTAGKTRRWGTSSLRSRPVAAASVLGAVAPLYFYPLLVRFDDPTTTFTLLGEDCFLLEALLMTLAALLRGVAAYPCARAMR